MKCNPESWPCVEHKGDFKERLLKWFGQHRRDLPWRRTHDPYAIWVSEIMLQQTQVVTVIPYYHRFLERFPDVKTLGAAEASEVLRYWEGLGYYRRARQMHAAAVRLAEENEGRFPSRFEEVLSLPGIGRYTAGAIMSFAFDQSYPILEANTLRLFSRLIGLREPLSSTRARDTLWKVAEAIVPEKKAGLFNQALMELGSLVCTPREPSCTQCPVAHRCQARQLGLEQVIPGAVKKLNYESVTEYALAIQDRQGRLWLRQRQGHERWAGLWDFPRYVPVEQPDSQSNLASADQIGFPVTIGSVLQTIQHGVTRFRITLHLHSATPRGRTPRSTPSARWYSLADLAQLPLTTPARKLLKAL